MKLDFSLKTPQERIALVERLISEDDFNPKYIEQMSNYILFVADCNQTKKEQKEERPIVTRNREVTVAKRQVSFEEIVANLENGEDGLYALIANDKNQIMDRKDPISEKDMEEIPLLKQNFELIESLKKQFDKATGKRKYSLKRQIIETWQQIYILKASFRGNTAKCKATNQVKNFAHQPIPEEIVLGADGMPSTDAMVSLINPIHVSFLLCNYSALKQECYDDLSADMFHLLLDLEETTVKALRKQPVLMALLEWKVDGLMNEEIQERMEKEYGIQHSVQYFSALWRKRIPKLIAEQAQKDWLVWHYTTEEYGSWKTCGKCGETKLAHPLFFSKNKGAKDNLYSICKECRKNG